MRKRILIYLVICQVILILIIVFVIVGKSNINVVQIPFKYDQFKSGGYQYYYEPKPNQVTKVLSQVYPAKYTINSDTLNSTKNYPVKKADKTFRIIALGDSFTFGLFVDTPKNWPSLLEKMLNDRLKCENYDDFEVINLGVAGYDAEYAVERYRLRGVKYNPDLLIWLHTDLNRVTEQVAKLYYKDKSKRASQEDLASRVHRIQREWVAARDRVSEILGVSKTLDFQKKAIENLNNLYKGKLIYAYVPEELRGAQIQLLQDLIRKRGNGFVVNNIRDIYHLNGAFPDGHPNELGHQIIAEDMFKFLVDNKIIECRNN